jgi:CubicO group peptidase (beta-lactamase class C family)
MEKGRGAIGGTLASRPDLDRDPEENVMTAPSVEDLLDNAVATGALPGVVAIVTGPDDVLLEHAAGRLSVDGDAPAGKDTVFRIASMTKALTSVAALQLVERGDLAVDTPVGEHLPELGALQVLDGFDGDTPRLRAPATPITLRHLMTHTSGLAYWFGHADLLRWYEVTGTPGFSAASARRCTRRSCTTRVSGGPTASGPTGSGCSSSTSAASRSTPTWPSTSSGRWG